jgi:hypothetical protein
MKWENKEVDHKLLKYLIKESKTVKIDRDLLRDELLQIGWENEQIIATYEAFDAGLHPRRWGVQMYDYVGNGWFLIGFALVSMIVFFVSLQAIVPDNTRPNASIKALVGNTRIEIVNIYHQKGSYESLCASEAITEMISAAEGFLPDNYDPNSQCNDGSDFFVISVKLLSPEDEEKWWCVDSNKYIGETNRQISFEETSCPVEKL